MGDYFRILFIGEIVGKAGVFCIKKLLPQLKKERNVHFIIANGDGTTGGYGLGRNHSVYLHKLGIDVITSGECIYYKKDMVPHIARSPYILRPANYPNGNPGYGWRQYTSGSWKINVVNILGINGNKHVVLKNPFFFIQDLIEKVSERSNIIVVDFHAATTAEKHAMDNLLAGKVSALIGTHARVLTADETILPSGTAVITDAGRTGSIYSVGGLEPSVEIRKYLTQIPEYSKDCWDRPALQGVIIDVDHTGTAVYVERLHIEVEDDAHDTEGNS